MKTLTLRIFENQCDGCGARFRTPHLAPEEHGLLLFASSPDDLVYVDADEDPVWRELEVLLPEAVPELIGTHREPGAFEAALAVTVSGIDRNYVPVRRVACPDCRSIERRFWGPVDPPLSERVQVPAADHAHWRQLSASEKRRAISEAVPLAG